jgi:hypothetical protein
MGEELLHAARTLNEHGLAAADVRAVTAALPLPRIRVHVTTGAFYLRVGPARLDVDPREPRGWEWLGYDPSGQCTHQRRADHQVWGPAWVDCVAVPTGVSTTHPGPIREFGREHEGRPGFDNHSVILEPGPPPDNDPTSSED